jgi:2-oxoglutarate dehydrogenase E2 component (dihydrolipoamide succinyltransferase)
VAVASQRGLVVPIIRDVQNLSLAQLEQSVAILADKARHSTLTMNDLTGGTFTITNGGVFGSLLSTPIINPPQTAILGMHKIEQRPVVVDNQIVIRPMMDVALSYDHRLIDGADAVQFLVTVKNLLQEPERLLLDL